MVVAARITSAGGTAAGPVVVSGVRRWPGEGGQSLWSGLVGGKVNDLIL